MKLTLNRRESTKVENGTLYYAYVDLRALPVGRTLYYLAVDLEATSEEMATIEKLNWGAMPLCKGELRGVSGRVDFDVSDVVGSLRLGFDDIGNLANVENQLVESVRKLNENLEAFTSGEMSIARRQLAEIYQRVVQDVLGFAATIEEDGDILFEHPDLGGCFISLNAERDPEYMKLMLPAFFDATRGVSRHDLVEICNRINTTAKLTALTVREDAGGSVVACVGLLLAAPDTSPSEALLRGVIGRAMSSIESAVKLFADELEKYSSDAATP